MKFVAIVAVGAAMLFGHVAATTTTNPTPTSVAVPTSTAEASELVKCLNKCDPKDVNCQAACVGVPYPNDSQANATVECVAACDKGNGSEADVQKYIKCSDGCINDNYLSSAGLPTPTGNSDDGDDNDANPTDSSGDGDSRPTRGSSPTDSSDVPDAAPALMVGSTMGLVGLVVAMVAL